MKGKNMNMSNNKPDMAGIEPVRYSLDDKFKFECHKGVKCFTKCCRGININLTPYDIIRLKNRLQLSSEEFLAKSCPFVRDDGCIIYEDRPTTCRYYPLGVASLSHKEGADDKDFYFFVHEPHCLGFEEEKIWTVREWRKDQGVDIHDEINAGWTDLLVRKRSFPKNVMLTEQSKKMFFLVSYNIDKFREFVFETSFLERYDIKEKAMEKIKEDELALLEFGIKWLKWLFFKDGDFKIKEEKKSN